MHLVLVILASGMGVYRYEHSSNDIVELWRVFVCAHVAVSMLLSLRI